MKYSPDQPRVPAGNNDGGQWTDGGGGGSASLDSSTTASDRRVLSDAIPDNFSKPGTQIAQMRGGRTRAGRLLDEMTPGQAARYEIANSRAEVALRRVQERDPEWRPTPSLTESVEGEIAAREGEAAEAEARLTELLRDAVPNTNPDWGVNRLRKELSDRGFVLQELTRSKGYVLRNGETGEEVRIMGKPLRQRRSESIQKHLSGHYYRYRPGDGKSEGAHIMIPDKD